MNQLLVCGTFGLIVAVPLQDYFASPISRNNSSRKYPDGIVPCFINSKWKALAEKRSPSRLFAFSQREISSLPKR